MCTHKRAHAHTHAHVHVYTHTHTHSQIQILSLCSCSLARRKEQVWWFECSINKWHLHFICVTQSAGDQSVADMYSNCFFNLQRVVHLLAESSKLLVCSLNEAWESVVGWPESSITLWQCHQTLLCVSQPFSPHSLCRVASPADSGSFQQFGKYGYFNQQILISLFLELHRYYIISVAPPHPPPPLELPCHLPSQWKCITMQPMIMCITTSWKAAGICSLGFQKRLPPL